MGTFWFQLKKTLFLNAFKTSFRSSGAPCCKRRSATVLLCHTSCAKSEEKVVTSSDMTWSDWLVSTSRPFRTITIPRRRGTNEQRHRFGTVRNSLLGLHTDASSNNGTNRKRWHHCFSLHNRSLSSSDRGFLDRQPLLKRPTRLLNRML